MKALKPRHWSVNMTSPNMSAALRGPSGFIRKGPMYLDGGEKKWYQNQQREPNKKKGTKVSQIRGTYPWWLGCRISTVLYWPPGQNGEGTEKRGKWKGIECLEVQKISFSCPVNHSRCHPDCRADWIPLPTADMNPILLRWIAADTRPPYQFDPNKERARKRLEDRACHGPMWFKDNSKQEKRKKMSSFCWVAKWSKGPFVQRCCNSSIQHCHMVIRHGVENVATMKVSMNKVVPNHHLHAHVVKDLGKLSFKPKMQKKISLFQGVSRLLLKKGHQRHLTKKDFKNSPCTARFFSSRAVTASWHLAFALSKSCAEIVTGCNLSQFVSPDTSFQTSMKGSWDTPPWCWKWSRHFPKSLPTLQESQIWKILLETWDKRHRFSAVNQFQKHVQATECVVHPWSSWQILGCDAVFRQANLNK